MEPSVPFRKNAILSRMFVLIISDEFGNCLFDSVYFSNRKMYQFLLNKIIQRKTLINTDF